LARTTWVVIALLQVTGVAWRLEAVSHPPPASLVYTITLTSSQWAVRGGLEFSQLVELECLTAC